MSKKAIHNTDTDAGKPEFTLVLYVTGSTPNSVKAINNVKVICDTYLKGNYTLDIVDVYKDASIAAKEQLLALPMLVKKFPQPERRLIGDMSATDKVLKGLGINE